MWHTRNTAGILGEGRGSEELFPPNVADVEGFCTWEIEMTRIASPFLFVLYDVKSEMTRIASSFFFLKSTTCTFNVVLSDVLT
jgi:hypothetical protein